MPSDIEIHFGFKGPEAVDAAVKALGLSMDDGGGTQVTATDLRQDPNPGLELDTSPLSSAIQDAYQAIAARLGWTHVDLQRHGPHLFDTPFGRRETGGFALSLHYDPEEVGDGPEDISLGVNLSARYLPAIIDIHSPHGTLNDGFCLEDAQRPIAICRNEIVKYIPAMNGAKTFTRTIFY